ncbi:MAG: putative periplasmic lipoprotein [Proteobacteria bacterium]|nr:putative periplasmic lipoprotein [Pseudomonadota bacterium]
MPDHAKSRRPVASATDDQPFAAAGGRGGARLSRRLVVVGLLAVAAAGCKILPIESETAAAQKKFNGADYVTKLWDSDVIPVVRDKAFPIETVIAAIEAGLDKAGPEFGHRPAEEGSPWSFVVKGTAVIKEKNTTSRAGTVLIDVTTPKGPIAVTIQIGPVVKGNSLRDAMPFINFQNFTNQLEFAEVGRAFNGRVGAELKTVADSLAPGQTIAYSGTFSLNSATDKILLTPVLIGPAGGAQ